MLERHGQMLEHQTQMLARQHLIIAQMDERAERVAQYTVRTQPLLTEQTLLFARSMALLDRISQRLEARPRVTRTASAPGAIA